jgi:hypothetical protein
MRDEDAVEDLHPLPIGTQEEGNGGFILGSPCKAASLNLPQLYATLFLNGLNQ